MAETSFILGGVQTLREIGFFDFFLPFILFFAIIYGALQKTQVFGEGRRDIDSIIAFVIALIASTTGWVLKGITGFLPWVGFTAIIIVCFLMLAAMVGGGDVSQLFKKPYFIAAGVIFIAVILFFGVFFTFGWDKIAGGVAGGAGISETDIALVIMLIIGLGAFALIVKGGGGGGAKKGE